MGADAMRGAGRLGALLIVCATLLAAPAAQAGTIASLDLAKPFGARSAWRFTAVQGADIPEPLMDEGGTVPGGIALCVAKPDGRCTPDLMAILRQGQGPSFFDEPHYLELAKIVPASGSRGGALLLVRAASLHSINGNQAVATQVLAYDRTADRFRVAYARLVGRNNNEEVRYIERGPLAGLIVAAEPTGDAPFGYWITVDRRTRPLAFTQVLRFRSATRYGDGNDLAVIDSEATNIARRLGLWRPGMKPLLPQARPARGCASPRLRGMALWCGPVAPRSASD